MLVWPPELPRPNREGWNPAFQDPRSDRAAEAGPALPRLNYSVVPRHVRQVMTMSRDQKAVFDIFLEHKTRFGTLPFLMIDPTTDGWPVLMPSGQPMLHSDGRPILLARVKRCFFGRPMPSETIAGNRFNISFTITVLP